MGTRNHLWTFALAALVACGSWSAATASTGWQRKVDSWVLDTAAAGDTEFLVVLREQADLSAASSVRGKEEKGRLVFEQLTATARRTQGPLLAELERLGVEHRGLWIVNMIWVRGGEAVVEAMASRPEVARVDGNPRVSFQGPVGPGGSARSPAGVEWNIQQVNADDVWALGFTGQGVVIGGQDTGYDWDHPALKDHYRGWDGDSSDHAYNWHDAIHSGGGICGADSLEPCDDHGHGTHTMGTMAGDDGGTNQIGMAPGARWIGCRNMDQGNGTPATYSECFEWFIAPTDLNDENPDFSKAPHVINNSWSCPASEGCTTPDILREVVENTREAGIAVVVSAGNDGSSCSSVANPPGIYEASFSVGATDSADNIAGFSSRGPVTVDGSGRLKPDISAPGVGVRSSFPGSGYGSLSGTSMAGPHVAGLVALALSIRPDLAGEVDTLEALIEQTAVPRTTTQTCGGVPGDAIPNNTYGWGRIDALALATLLLDEELTDLGLTLADAPDPVTAGEIVQLTATVENLGPVDAQQVEVSFLLPSGFTFEAAVGASCSPGTPVVCAVGNMAVGASVDLALDARVDLLARGSKMTTATVSHAQVDPNPENDQASVITTVVASGFVVTTTADTLNGQGCLPDDCSLRDAVLAANAAPGMDDIELPEGTFGLTREGSGEDAAESGDLDVTSNLRLRGAGRSRTVIDANGIDRAFDARGGALLEISRLTLRGGDAGGEPGGAIRSASGPLQLTDVRVLDSVAASGGALAAAGAVTLTGTEIAGNEALSGDGGGVEHTGGSPVSVEESTLADNVAAGAGGAVAIGGEAAIAFTNSTLSQNSATAGGAIALASGNGTLENVTLANNQAAESGGGLFAEAAGDLTASNSILAANSAPAGPDCAAHLQSLGYTLLGNDGGCDFTTAAGDQIGSAGSPIDPLLGPLGDHRGPTPTHPLLVGSPALDAASPQTPGGGGGACEERDQRGFPRPWDGLGDETAQCDIGAFELCNPAFTDSPPLPPSFAPYIGEVFCRGISSGCSTSPLRFCPHDPISRKQMAVFLVRAAGEQGSVVPFDQYFDDVADDGFAPYINRLQELGVSSGCGVRQFCPAVAVTREQMAVFLVLAAGESPSSVPYDAYFDDVADNELAPYINRVFELGITSGCGGGGYCPQGEVSRGQMAVFLSLAF